MGVISRRFESESKSARRPVMHSESALDRKKRLPLYDFPRELPGESLITFRSSSAGVVVHVADVHQTPPVEELPHQKCSALRGELDSSTPRVLGGSPMAILDLDRKPTELQSTIYRSRSRTAIRKTPDTPGVEESSSPRRVVRFQCSDSSVGRI